MSFFQKLSETAKATASVIGAKSSELASAGKMKMEIMQLSGKVKDKKTELGHYVYAAYTAGQEPDKTAISGLCTEIKAFEDQIAQFEEMMKDAESQQV